MNGFRDSNERITESISISFITTANSGLLKFTLEQGIHIQSSWQAPQYYGVDSYNPVRLQKPEEREYQK